MSLEGWLAGQFQTVIQRNNQGGLLGTDSRAVVKITDAQITHTTRPLLLEDLCDLFIQKVWPVLRQDRGLSWGPAEPRRAAYSSEGRDQLQVTSQQWSGRDLHRGLLALGMVVHMAPCHGHRG